MASPKAQVKRRTLTLVILGAVVVLLGATGGLLAWHPWGAGSADSTTPSAPPLKFVQISQVDRDLLHSIELISPAGSITLDNQGGSWQIVKPAVLKVNQARVDDILYSLANLGSERVIEESPRDVSIYGLKPPAVTVRMTLTTGEVRELYLGDVTPAGDSYYLMAKGDPRVFTVREHHGEYFHYGVRELWEGGITPVDGTDIVYLRLRKAGRTVVELKKTPELYTSDIEFRGSSLSVVYPYVASPKPADLGFLGQFAKAFSSMGSTIAIEAGLTDLSKYGLDAPGGELEMRDGKGNALHVFIGRQDSQELFVRFAGDPTVYAADPNVLAVVAVEPFQFVSKYAAIVKLDNVDRLSFDAGATRHVLEVKRVTPGSEDGAQWLVDGRAVDVKAFKDFYTAAMSLQTDAFRDRAVSGEPDLTMTFSLNKGSVRSFTVRFVPYSQEFYAVLKNGAGDILVNRQQVKVLLQRLEELAAAASAGKP